MGLNLRFHSEVKQLKGKYLYHKDWGVAQVKSATNTNVRVGASTIKTYLFIDKYQYEYEYATEEQIKEYLDNQEKYGVFFIEERNGEREYTHKLVKVFTGDENVKGEHIAQSFYDNNTDTVDDWYMFDGGEVAVRFSSVNIVTKDEYKILNKYCI
jgi:hypothetical protein